MKNIFRIFFADRKRIGTNVVAVVIIMGLVIVPPLYAWFNILSNWDPYEPEATSQIKVAVASDDDGYSLEGIEINLGNTILTALEKNTAIGWVFTDTTKEAIDGVYSGDYYAALIMPQDFSEQMMSFLTEDFVHPQILYYENQKKNAIAPKITSKAQQALSRQVNSTMFATIAETLVENLNMVVGSELAQELGVSEDASLLDVAIEKMGEVNDQLVVYGTLVDNLIQIIDTTQSAMNTMTSKSDVQKVINQSQSKIDQMQSVLDSSVANMFSVSSAVGKNLSAIETVLSSVSSAYRSVNGSAKTLDETLDEAKEALTQTSELITDMQTDLENTLEQLNEIRSGDGYAMLLSLLEEDPETVGDFLASPVEMETVSIYPIDNYGSAMSSFYTVLALWVGALVSVALLHTRVELEPEFADANLIEQFFGRYLIFYLVGQAQALLCVLGNLFYIGIQREHPFLLWLAASVTSFAFTMIMYSMVFALDNVGQAAAVVIMVIQVAGAGGTFPIQCLPQIFQDITAFLPFPYAMDALRECVGGFYQNDYWRYLSMLIIFAVVFFALNVLISIPAAKLNALITKSKKNTGVML